MEISYFLRIEEIIKSASYTKSETGFTFETRMVLVTNGTSLINGSLLKGSLWKGFEDEKELKELPDSESTTSKYFLSADIVTSAHRKRHKSPVIGALPP